MKFVRPVEAKDYDDLARLADQASLGITSLPKDKTRLKEILDNALQAIEESRNAPHHLHYMFVLDDTEGKKITGTSALQAKTGVNCPAYFYRLEKVKHTSSDPLIPRVHSILRPVSYENGPTELCGLFLDREARKSGLGKLLSYSRFLFMASHPRRFTETVIAEMRGYIDEHETSPFWEALGRHFYDVSTKKAIEFVIHQRPRLKEILPEFPIYCDLLPASIRELIGATHPHTAPALEILLKQGFRFSGEVDVIDAGPKIIAERENIQTIRDSKLLTVSKCVDRLSGGELALVSNQSLRFRVALGEIEIEEQSVIITNELAEVLQVGPGDWVRTIFD